MVVWLSKTIDNSIVQLQLSNASAPDDGIYWCGPVSGNKSQGVNISVTVAGNNLVYFHFDIIYTYWDFFWYDFNAVYWKNYGHHVNIRTPPNLKRKTKLNIELSHIHAWINYKLKEKCFKKSSKCFEPRGNSG